MSKITKPMLAGKCEDINSLEFPVLCSPKLDGVRSLVIEGRCVSRRWKPIPNDYIRQTIEAECGQWQLDGEIIIPGRSFSELSGDVRRKDGRPTNFVYAVFDVVAGDLSEPYETRMERLAKLSLPAFCKKVLPKAIATPEALLDYEKECLELGYEGVMIRRFPIWLGMRAEFDLS